ncbi:hypothetical protein E1A91_A05G316600v1 [Gossypium mustelinum]|uniref:Uncharacterized protein n=1 Tax=Gossypium mustelinum TaxID=34275 RepID=A0A5D2ZG00_GOSMU|nr:hypothetical protein E1A91_A05G316600v1 [Gossypium mustelinum]
MRLRRCDSGAAQFVCSLGRRSTSEGFLFVAKDGQSRPSSDVCTEDARGWQKGDAALRLARVSVG